MLILVLDMQRLLYEKAVELGVIVKLNTRVASIRQSEAGGPEVVCKDDTIISGDLVVGADGLWSRCRESLLGATDHPLPTGDLAYRITLTLDQIKDEDLRKFVSEPTLHFWVSHFETSFVSTGVLRGWGLALWLTAR